MKESNNSPYAASLPYIAVISTLSGAVASYCRMLFHLATVKDDFLVVAHSGMYLSSQVIDLQSVEVSLGSHGKIMKQWGDLRSLMMSLDFTCKNQSILEYVQRYERSEKSQGRVLLLMRFRREENMTKVPWQFSLQLRSYNDNSKVTRRLARISNDYAPLLHSCTTQRIANRSRSSIGGSSVSFMIKHVVCDRAYPIQLCTTLLFRHLSRIRKSFAI